MAKWLVYVDSYWLQFSTFCLLRSLKVGPHLCCPQVSKEELLGYTIWAHLKADILPAVAWNIRGPTCNFMSLPTRPGGNWAPAILPWAAAGHSPEVSLPCYYCQHPCWELLVPGSDFPVSLSLSRFILGSVIPYGGTASIWVWIQHQLFTSRQRKAVCWQVLWVLGKELRNLS